MPRRTVNLSPWLLLASTCYLGWHLTPGELVALVLLLCAGSRDVIVEWATAD